jgi:EAL domain-containing protein (putative c-di-GMP-specific phosphodiesterase class I)
MPLRNLPVLLLQSALALIAMGCCVAIFFMTKNQTYVALIAMCCLGLGQLISVVQANIAAARLDNHADNFDNALYELGNRASTLDERLDHGMAKLAKTEQRSQSQEHSFAEGLSGLRQSYTELSQHLAQSLANDRREPHFPPAQFSEPLVAQPPQAGPAPAPAMPVISPETFVTALEPIIDVNTGATIHYRVRVSLEGHNTPEVSAATLTANADLSGARPELDRFVVGEALSLIERLRQRNANLKIFMALGVPTLLDQNALRDILQMLNAEQSLASGLVMEVTHAALAGLSEPGIAGLALLARSGVAMALADVTISGLDMPSLRHLGVRFLGLPAQGLMTNYGLSPAIIGFAQSARAMQFQMIVTDVASPEVAASVPQVARFACGPFFASPRRVKSMADRARETDQRRAA